MSKIGKQPVNIPEGVTIKVVDKRIIVKGGRGELSDRIPKEISISLKDGQVVISPTKKTKLAKALYGTYRMLVHNMVIGVSEGWKKELELVGTGYRVEGSGNKISLKVGYSHPVEVEAPADIEFSIEKTKITVRGIDKQVVGQVAADIRKIRPPEPYKGKGIKYIDEEVRRKPGKAAKAAGEA